MAQMAIDILGRTDLDVLVYSAGRSLDNHHIAALPSVRSVAISDVIRLRDDAEFYDSSEPATRRFPVVIASEVIEHFLEPRADFERLFGSSSPTGCSSARRTCTTVATCAVSRTSSRPATPPTTRRRHWRCWPPRTAGSLTCASRWWRPATAAAQAVRPVHGLAGRPRGDPAPTSRTASTRRPIPLGRPGDGGPLGQTRRAKSSFESSRPRVVSTTRSSVVTSSSSAARAHPKTSASGGSCDAASGMPCRGGGRG